MNGNKRSKDEVELKEGGKGGLLFKFTLLVNL